MRSHPRCKLARQHLRRGALLLQPLALFFGLQITRRLAKTGAASSVEVLRLERQRSDLQLKILDLRSQYLVQAREELAKALEKLSR